jgi:hypothetical protein
MWTTLSLWAKSASAQDPASVPVNEVPPAPSSSPERPVASPAPPTEARAEPIWRAEDAMPYVEVRPNRHCVVPASVDGVPIEWEAANGACKKKLQPLRITPVIQTPGAFFFGKAWGSKSSSVAYGPAVGLSGAILFPISRPRLDYTKGIKNGPYDFSLPTDPRLMFDIIASLNANIAGLKFHDTPEPAPGAAAAADTQIGFSFGGYVGFAPGVGWYSEDGQLKKVSFTIGVLAGYLTKTDPVGDAFLLGVQPALTGSF